MRKLLALVLACLLLCGCTVRLEPVRRPYHASNARHIMMSGTKTLKLVLRQDLQLGEVSPSALAQAALEVSQFAFDNSLDVGLYRTSLIYLMARNPQTTEYVLNYPFKYGTVGEIDLAEYADTDTVPLFMQWDQRWGYMEYGNDMVGLTGCGPVCLSMVAYHFLRNGDTTPDKIVQFALDNGYCAPGNGSYWALMDQGGRQLGLNVVPFYEEEAKVLEQLALGNPIICIMGPGDFTTGGHFIVMVGLEDGLVRVNDPNSYTNSEKLWNFADIQDQINGMWLYRDPAELEALPQTPEAAA